MKKLSDLKDGKLIYTYSIDTLNKKEVFNIKELKIKQTHRSSSGKWGAKAEEINYNGFRNIYEIEHNEGVVFKNALWLSENNSKLAKDIMIKYFNTEIEDSYIYMEDLKKKKELLLTSTI